MHQEKAPLPIIVILYESEVNSLPGGTRAKPGGQFPNRHYLILYFEAF
jgi:hypothetical protein